MSKSNFTSKNTSIAGGVVKEVASMFKKGKISGTVLEVGAGRTARNANWLRSQGLKVYAYDPYWGTDVDGWKGTSNTLPEDFRFDIAFSTYVLNVVSPATEKNILGKCEELAKKSFHITRNEDIFKTVKESIYKNKYMKDFFIETFPMDYKILCDLEEGILDDAVIWNYCRQGVRTGKDTFQRVPFLEETGCYTKDKETKGFKVYLLSVGIL